MLHDHIRPAKTAGRAHYPSAKWSIVGPPAMHVALCCRARPTIMLFRTLLPTLTPFLAIPLCIREPQDHARVLVACVARGAGRRR